MSSPQALARLPERHELAALPAIEAAGDAMFAALGLTMPAETVTVERLAAAPLVLVTGQPVNGFAMVDELDGTAHLAQLSVHPDHGRQGLGTGLLAAAIAWAQEAGYPAMTLTTFADVPWNGPFYRRHGFVMLDDAEQTPGLRAHRDHEREAGLDGLAPRAAMRRRLD